ncbi:MAG: LytR/AlgR family response regulator transcription factor, partial [Faecalibacillus intestinalis]
SLKSGKINYHIIKNNILYIESYRNYIVIHTSISDYTLRYTLKKIQKKLSNEFIQCHKSYLVNLNNVICIKEKFIELKNKITLPIGNKYKQNLHNLICK